MKILVTGGVGFIGSHLVDTLMNNGEKVVVFDNFSRYYSGKEKNIKQHIGKKNFKLIRGSILDKKSLNRAMNEIEIVVHLAAQPGVRYSIQHPMEVAKINVNGTINVLDSCVKNNIKKMIFGSSSSVYGDVEKIPVTEDMKCNPISPYGVSKLAGEKYCQYYSKLYGIEIPILRFFTVYGSRQRPDMAINKFVTSVMNNKSPIIFGDGSQTRDFTYISDIVNGILLSIRKKSKTDIFNLGGAHNISVNELIGLIISYCGKENIVSPEYIEKQEGDVKDTLADNSKAGKILRWKPKVRIEKGIRRYIEWFKFTHDKAFIRKIIT